MDLCHCIEPAPEKIRGAMMCLNCRLYYDEAEWLKDPRVKKVKTESRNFTDQQRDIVETIMREADHE